ncbi:related to glycosylasparaginase [Cephalotrichum gorgonifer]|uniref:Related to glycosylasparaginase n=1 Tax=Cephalotrichum gorgonifer TaxID=2041049 RepID=A0AAE8MZ69_9PEZI|nr:related to glycosylasparaginase [Cephalotrichum gorgonifer]
MVSHGLRLLPILCGLAHASSPHPSPPPGLPFVINTWSGPFTAATDAAYSALTARGATALDAVEIGCATCERNQCDGTVGWGGSPAESCETTLDALIMDGRTMDIGAVAGLRRVREAISVARRVLEFTEHSMLSGDLATEFAVQNGFEEVDLASEESLKKCEEWKSGGCQPNYRRNVKPDPEASCGPYEPIFGESGPYLGDSDLRPRADRTSHDTISLIAIDKEGRMAAGTSTNGASYKVPGRVGDGPIPGSGSYVDEEFGGCGATGDGDIMMRFLPCYQAVENLRRGMSPRDAAEDVVRRIAGKYPEAMTGIIVVDRKGNHAGAASGWTFTYAFRGGKMDEVEVVSVAPLEQQLVRQL